MKETQSKIAVLAWCLGWGVLSTAWCWTSAFALSDTFDEPFYFRAGLTNWRSLNHRELLTQGTMPLPAEVQTLPVRLAELFLGVNAESDFTGWLPIARMANAVFWWLLLWAAYRLASFYGGRVAGCLAVAFLACEPILLGHASLATADVPATACLLALLAVFRRRRECDHWLERIVVPSFFVTLTYLAKATALVFVPACLGMVELERLLSKGWRPGRGADARRTALASVRDLTAIIGLGVVLLFVVCPRAFRGLSFQITHNSGGHGDVFLLGQWKHGGFWYYFPAALLIKLSLPYLGLLAGSLVLQPRRWLNGATCAALGLLLLTPIFRVQIGVRLVLPIAVLALCGSAAAAAAWWSSLRSGRARAISLATVLCLLLWSAADSCLAWPHGICFTNEMFGGTREGYRVLVDSNYDWGQGLKDLAAWQKQHPEAPMNVCYFGWQRSLDGWPVQRVSSQATMQELVDVNRGCYLAVSTHFICSPGPFADLLATLTPCGRTMTYFIYDFRDNK